MVFGLFSKERALQKTIEKAINKLAQQPDRWGALEKLREDGTDEALYGLCKRFGVTSMKGVEDEQEKTWVVETLVEKASATLPMTDEQKKLADRQRKLIDEIKKTKDDGERKKLEDERKRNDDVQRALGEAAEAARAKASQIVLDAVIRYMQTAEQLAFPLKVVERIADHDKIIAIVDRILATEPPGYVRMPDRRIDLFKWFSEWKAATDDDIVPRVTPYISDFDENVRFAVIDGLASRDPKRIAGPLIDALVRPDEESGRI